MINPESIFSNINRQKTWYVLSAITLCIFLYCFFLLVLNVSKGLDITDRSFYLLWANQPENVVSSATHFGYITKPIYDLAGQNISAFRLLGVIILLGSASIFIHSFGLYGFNTYFKKDTKYLFTSFLLIVFVATLSYYRSWLHAPSYNLMAVAATFITVSGLLYFISLPRNKIYPWLAALLVSIGGVIAFVAKPTTAMSLAIISILFVLIHGINKKTILFLTLSGCFATGFLTAFGLFFFGSINAYIDNLIIGAHISDALGAGHSIKEIIKNSADQAIEFIKWFFSRADVLFFVLATIILTLLFFLKKGPSAQKRKTILLSRCLLLIFLFIFFIWLLVEYQLFGKNHHISTILFSLFGICFIAWTYNLFTSYFFPDSEYNPTCLYKGLLFSILFVVVSFASSFGTNNNIIRHVSISAVFIAVSIFIIFQLITPQKVRTITTCFLGILMTVMVGFYLNNAYNKPYRLPGNIADQTVLATFVNPKHRLFLDSSTAQYAQDLMDYALKAGWEQGTPLIDMTGGSPGALVILDARIVGTPWILGGYTGSNIFAEKVLSSVDYKLLEQAWILTAPNGRRQISDQVLKNVGLKFPDEYGLVGIMKTGHRNETQMLWKPGADM